MIHGWTTAEALAAEERTLATQRVAPIDLMRRAGAALAAEVRRVAPDGRVTVVVGKGNNGGDGWVAARKLAGGWRDVKVLALDDPDASPEAARIAASEAISAGVLWAKITTEGDAEQAITGSAVVVDALFGVGLSGAAREPYAGVISAIARSGVPVVSADMPSGVETDTGRVLGPAVTADVTVTFGGPKVGLLMYPGAAHAGEVVVADIGLEQGAGSVEIWGRREYASVLPRPARAAHKSERGRVLVVAGSLAFPGAAVLAAWGAQRMGAGYVTVAVPESALHAVHSKLVSAVAVGLPENPSHTFASRAEETLIELSGDHDAVVVGPGLTLARGAVLLTRRLVKELQRPLVIDADGLNALVDATDSIAQREAVTVITPHPGELGRLLGMSTAEVQADRLSCASKLASPHCACVLKGARTLISDGSRTVVNMTGGPALASAGTGDVLAGMVGTLLAQGVAPLGAGALAVYIHGLAGDLAASKLTEVCVTAEDVPNAIPYAVAELCEEQGDRDDVPFRTIGSAKEESPWPN